jgi:tRNA(fMet)-specific endonuclease VapC
MKYVLDTNICIHFLKGMFNLNVKIQEVGLENCFISEITLLELEYGVENSDSGYYIKQKEILEKFTLAFNNRILPIRDCFTKYAKERVKLRKSGQLISDFDLLIGCTALQNDYVMVTENIREFSRLENIKIENWVIRS